jgi:Cu/Ag efflux pump CusA
LLVWRWRSFPLIGKSFMPTLDEGDLLIQLEKLPSISLEESLALDTRRYSRPCWRVPEVAGVVARAGSDELGLDPMGLNQTDSFLVLKPREQWRKPDKEWLMEEIRKVMNGLPRRHLRLHPAHRHACFGNADRLARRPGGQGVRHRHQHPEHTGRCGGNRCWARCPARRTCSA